MYEVTIRKSFSAAHVLKEIGGKCEEMHGHNFLVEVSVAGEALNREGVLIDFRVLKGWTGEVLDALDHKCLNDLPPFREADPSSENIARHIHDALARRLAASDPAAAAGLRISGVAVWESDNARVVYRRP